MNLDFTKLSAAFGQIDAATRRGDLASLGTAGANLRAARVSGASAALSAAEKAGAALDRIDAYGVGTGLAGVRGTKLGSLASEVLGTGLGDVKGLGIPKAKLTPLGLGLPALAGFHKESSLSAAARLAKPPSWTEPASGLLGVTEKMAEKPAELWGFGGTGKWSNIGSSASLMGASRSLWGYEPVRELSSFRKSRAFGGFEPRWVGVNTFWGAEGLVGSGGVASGAVAFGGLFEPFESIWEMVRKTFGWADMLRPHWDGWAWIVEEAMRAAERIASQPESSEGELLAFAAYDALEAMTAGKHWVAMNFLERQLNLRATPERLEALWIFLKRGFERPIESSPLWLTLDGRQAKAYLATAVFRGAERIKRRRQMDDDIWATCNGKELVRPGSDRLVYIQDQTTDDFADSSADPAKLAEHGMYDHNRILDELMMTGTSVDKEIVGLIRARIYDRADIRNIVGSDRFQAFERKIRRRIKNGKN